MFIVQCVVWDIAVVTVLAIIFRDENDETFDKTASQRKISEQSTKQGVYKR